MYCEWPLNTFVPCPIFRQQSEPFQPVLINDHTEYSDPDEDETSSEVILSKPETYEHCVLGAPPSQQALLFFPFSGQLWHLKWWLLKYFAEPVDIFHIYTEMGNDEHTEMQLKVQD